MSKQAAEHHGKAAEHHEHAARHHREASKHHEAGNYETAAHHAHSHKGIFITPHTMQRRQPNLTLSTTVPRRKPPATRRTCGHGTDNLPFVP
jgi:hypothetical protein